MTKENQEENLAQLSCVPCKGDVPAMGMAEAKELLSKLHEDWVINDQGHLERVFLVKNFVQALDLANQFGDIAEKEGHHPDLVVSYGRLTTEIWTHKISGLSHSDFVLAAKFDELLKIRFEK